jgi:hypothetical protein
MEITDLLIFDKQMEILDTGKWKGQYSKNEDSYEYMHLQWTNPRHSY